MRAFSASLRVTAAAAALALAAGCDDGGSSTPPDRLLDPHEASALIDTRSGDPDFVILDVRTADEFSQGHIEGAVNIDYFASDFEDQLAALDRAASYLVYCRSGVRSASAVEEMKDLGFVDVYDLDGGITAWIDAGYPTVT